MGKGDVTRQAIYRFICEYMDDNGVSPTVREICEGVGLKSPASVFTHLKRLDEEGVLTFRQGQKRSIVLNGRTPPRQVPLVGEVTAGQPMLAAQNIEGYLPIEPSLRRGHDLFALRIRGDSMVDAGILDGDLVIVEQTPVAADRDIVVAMIDDVATVKRFFRRRDGGFRLQPENAAYEPIEVDELVILGKVVALYRDRVR